MKRFSYLLSPGASAPGTASVAPNVCPARGFGLSRAVCSERSRGEPRDIRRWLTLGMAICAALGMLVFLLIPSFTQAQEGDPKKLFAEANRLYDRQNYPGAIQLYERLADEGVRTPALYYNLASVCFKTKAIGKSVLYLLRAQKLSPGDDDVEGNLRFVSQFTLDKGTLSSPPLAFFTELFPLGAWALWATIFYFLLAGIFALRIWFKSRTFFLRWGTWLVGILLVLFAFGFYLSWNWSKVPKGVLLAKEAPVKSGPGEDFVTQLLGHEGLTFQILEERPDYYEVLLPNGVKGWLKKDEATKV